MRVPGSVRTSKYIKPFEFQTKNAGLQYLSTLSCKLHEADQFLLCHCVHANSELFFQ